VLRQAGKPESLIEYVTDRPGHDRRYALSSEKLMRETGGAGDGFRDGVETNHRVVRREFGVGRAGTEREYRRITKRTTAPCSGALKVAGGTACPPLRMQDLSWWRRWCRLRG